MKKIILSMTVCLFAVGAWAAEVDWQKSCDSALEKAKKEKKIVMVDIYTDWCGWCKRLDRDTYSDKDVQAKLAKDFISVKVNPEKSDAGAKLAQQFGVRGFPFIGFVGADGKLVTQISGYLPAAEFLKKLEQVTAK